MGYYDAITALQNMAQLKQRKREAGWGQLKDVAGLGMDIWEKLSRVPEAKELASFNSGLAQNEASFSMGLENKQYDPNSPRSKYEQHKLDIELQKNEDWLDYQNKNPSKPSEQLYAEWLMTPAGKLFLKDQEDRRMREISANKGTASETDLTNRLRDSIESVTMMRPDWTIIDPKTGGSVLDLTKAKEIKEAVLATFSNPAERAWAAGVIDKTLMTWKPGMGGTDTGGNQPKNFTVGNPSYKTVQDITKNAQDMLRLLENAPDLSPEEKDEVQRIAPLFEGSLPAPVDQNTMKLVLDKLNKIYNVYESRKRGTLGPNPMRELINK